MVRKTLVDLVGDESIALIINIAIPIIILFFTNLLRVNLANIVDRVLSSISVVKQRSGVEHDSLFRDIEDVLIAPLKLLVVSVGLWLAVVFIDLESGLRSQINSFIVTIGIIAIFWVIFLSIQKGFTFWRQMTMQEDTKTQLSETVIQFLRRIVQSVVIIFGIITISEQWGLNLTALLAGLGIGGLAIALAAQDTLSNLVGYFSIIGDRPFEVGDYIISTNYEGVVEVIGFRTTRVRRPDRAVVYIPNHVLANDILTNWSETSVGPPRGTDRILFYLGLTYNTTADQMESVIQDIRENIMSHPLIDDARVNFTEFGSSSLDITILFFVRAMNWTDIQETKEAVNLGIMRIIAAHGLSVAFPTRTVILEQGDTVPEFAAKVSNFAAN